ncbi:MAG: nucleotide-binding protein [Bacteroidales bacterium]|nr:nucleotide-binding protein [Bacteroidales bacterium]
MKRKIFIGSSSEGLKIAQAIKKKIEDECGDWLQCDIWNEGEVFKVNSGTLDSLIRASRRYDYGILVATADDKSIKRKIIHKSMRDNVLFEMGLFLGSLGLDRAFLFANTKISIPSDFNGVTLIRYHKKSDIKPKVSELVDHLTKTKNSYPLKPLPSSALALGYYENYVVHLARKLSEESPDWKLYIIVPTETHRLLDRIKRYKEETNSNQVFHERPFTHQYPNDLREYWDIPTTLLTLDKLVDFLNPVRGIGIDNENMEWKKQEIRNFTGTLQALINKDPFKDNIEFKEI